VNLLIINLLMQFWIMIHPRCSPDRAARSPLDQTAPDRFIVHPAEESRHAHFKLIRILLILTLGIPALSAFRSGGLPRRLPDRSAPDPDREISGPRGPDLDQLRPDPVDRLLFHLA
jgi:hypothetical protein